MKYPQWMKKIYNKLIYIKSVSIYKKKLFKFIKINKIMIYIIDTHKLRE